MSKKIKAVSAQWSICVYKGNNRFHHTLPPGGWREFADAEVYPTINWLQSTLPGVEVSIHLTNPHLASSPFSHDQLVRLYESDESSEKKHLLLDEFVPVWSEVKRTGIEVMAHIGSSGQSASYLEALKKGANEYIARWSGSLKLILEAGMSVSADAAAFWPADHRVYAETLKLRQVLEDAGRGQRVIVEATPRASYDHWHWPWMNCYQGTFIKRHLSQPWDGDWDETSRQFPTVSQDGFLYPGLKEIFIYHRKSDKSRDVARQADHIRWFHRLNQFVDFDVTTQTNWDRFREAGMSAAEVLGVG